MHLNHIATYVAVVETRSFRAAAEVVHVSQSAVSVRIQQLEDVVGVPLLHRTTRSVDPTAAGWRFFAVARSALSELDRITLGLNEEAQLQRGVVTVAAMPSTAATLLPETMKAFIDIHPGITLKQTDIDSSRILEATRRGEIDLGLTTESVGQPDVDFLPLFREECVLVTRARDNRATRQTISLQESLKLPLLVSPAGSKLRQVIDEAYAAAGLTLAPSQEAWQMQTLLGLVEAGLGAAIMPTSATRRLAIMPTSATRRLEGEGIEILAFDQPIGRIVGVLRARNRSESPAVRAFREFLLSRFGTDQHLF